MRRTLLLTAGFMSAGAVILAQPTITGVVNAASYDPTVCRGGLVAIFGTGLARSAVSATSLPLPTRLDGTAVLVGDLQIEAPLYFVSPGQINFQLPFEVLGERLSVVVSTAAGRSAPFVLSPATACPGIFTRTPNGKGPALLFGSNFQAVEVVTPGQPIIFYATGLGPTEPPARSGAPGASSEPFHRVTNLPEVFVGDAPANVVFAGLAPGLAGVYQVNAVPQSSATDRFWMRSRGQASNITEVGIQTGRNVTNAGGTVELLYPSSLAGTEPFDAVGYSPHVVVARFTAKFDIAADAGRFSVAAVAEGNAISLVTFDPANGTFEGTVTVPTAQARVGDFSNTGQVAMDLFTCHRLPDGSPTCQPFPGSIIPPSRIPPAERQALSLVPLPNSPAPGETITALLRVRGEARRGTTFLINAENNSALSVFAGYVTIPLPPDPNRKATLKLFIDGQRVASTEVSYRAGPFAP
jgi:uncharacterized protein (TIGR03437 family)